MSAEVLRRAAALIRQRAEARKVMPEGASMCDRADHPARLHGHYGYGGRYSCTDFGSPLLSEENMGSRRLYAKPVESHDTFLLAVADLLDNEANAMDRADSFARDYADIRTHPYNEARRSLLLAVARAYLGESA